MYEKRHAVLKAINKFWPVAIMNYPVLSMHAQHNSDPEDVWLVRDPIESCCFTFESVSATFLFPFRTRA